MKTKILILFMTLTIFGCGPDYKSEVEKLKCEQDSLMALQSTKDSLITSYMNEFNEIQSSIESLAQQEKLLSEKSINNELTPDSKTKLLNQIESIKKVIEENKNKILSLQTKIKKYNSKINELDKMIANLNVQLLQRDSSIASLTENINQLNSKITTVELELSNTKSDNQLKAQEIQDKTNKLHTAYFTVGTYKDLRDKKIISKEGGLLGVGSNSVMSSNINTDSFTKIDYTSTKLIDIVSKKADIISVHPPDSYKLITNGKQIMALEILDPEKFWKASKYLIVIKS